MKYSVISLEDGIACLESEENVIVRIDVSELPENVKEGDILRFDGTTYVVDAAATSARRAEVYNKFNRLFKK